MRGLAHRRVVHVQVVADGRTTSPELRPTRIRSQTVRAAYFVGIWLHRRLHGQGGITGPQGMVFVGDRGAKQGHDAVAQHLVDGALEAMHGVHHDVQGRVQEPPGLFRVKTLDQLRRAFDVGEGP